MVKICWMGLLKLNFETRPKKRTFRFLPKISAGHGWSFFFFCQFPNPWTLRVSGMGGYTSKCEKESKSLHPIAHISGLPKKFLSNFRTNYSLGKLRNQFPMFCTSVKSIFLHLREIKVESKLLESYSAYCIAINLDFFILFQNCTKKIRSFSVHKWLKSSMPYLPLRTKRLSTADTRVVMKSLQCMLDVLQQKHFRTSFYCDKSYWPLFVTPCGIQTQRPNF